MSERLALQPHLQGLAHGRRLDAAEAEEAFGIILDDGATPAQIAGLLMAMRVRGESAVELAGAVRAMRKRMKTVSAPDDAFDNCGTGGDGQHTWNISTAAAFVLAGAGVHVAKHGNRAASSKSGTSDVLAALGIKVEQTPGDVTRILSAGGIAFMFAPAFHPALASVAPVRKELGVRTLFNLVGPLANPAGVKRQLIGAGSQEAADSIAGVVAELGTEATWVVHGAGGLDELSTLGESRVHAIENGKRRTFFVSPEDAGLARARIDDLRGGDPADNAAALLALLDGAKGAYRDIVVLNAAAGLVITGKAPNIAEGARLAEAVIDRHEAKAAFNRLKHLSHAP
ncbi:MAG TPA: anthranilate phosphoribosyltransferase [Micropepsaceae bacterium]|nr:anthranilate phosphoribosyltransferase [Micropepsaceae bacterium]